VNHPPCRPKLIDGPLSDKFSRMPGAIVLRLQIRRRMSVRHCRQNADAITRLGNLSKVSLASGSHLRDYARREAFGD
jgi:hypothetical protein